MATSRAALARVGQVSVSGLEKALAGSGIKNATLSATRVQRSKMAEFSSPRRDEGELHNNRGDRLGSKSHINTAETQRDRAGSLPRGGAAPRPGGTGKGAVGSAARSTSPQGGAVQAGYVPGREQIDGFPQRQRATWPKDTGMKGAHRKGFTGNTRMKGPVARTGGPHAMYGGPSRQRN